MGDWSQDPLDENSQFIRDQISLFGFDPAKIRTRIKEAAAREGIEFLHSPIQRYIVYSIIFILYTIYIIYFSLFFFLSFFFIFKSTNREDLETK